MRPFSTVCGLLFLSACGTNESKPTEPSTTAPRDAEPTCVDDAASAEEVTVANAYGKLAGTLSLPDRCGPVPVVVILSGTGQSDRDANGPNGTYQTNAYAMLSDALVTTAHVAVLRYDDHGVGESVTAMPKDNTAFTFDLEITDAGRWVEQLRADARFSKVFLAGHSLGSLMGTLVAQREQVDGVISLEGAGRPMSQVFHDQVVSQMTDGELATFDAALSELAAGRLPGELPGIVGEALPLSYQPYLASFMKYDPGDEFAKLEIPALIVRGEFDEEVLPIDATTLHERKPDAPVVQIPGMAHMLKRATSSASSQNAARTKKNVPLAEGLPPALKAFLDAHW